MAIDRIGNGGAPPRSPETPGGSAVDKTGATEKTFSVERPSSEPATAAAATEVSAASATSPLARLQAGDIDLDRYMDLKVDEATRGLAGLSPSELDDVKKVLKDQMATDPGLSDLIHSATGRTPAPPED